MTIGAGITVADEKLNVLGNCVLTDLPDNVFVTPAAGDAFSTGAFVGVQSDQIGSRRVFPLGKLEYVLLNYTFWIFLKLEFKLFWLFPIIPLYFRRF